ncbi:hypothetical protein PR048_000052 [Dryococelus australis]|uniref:Uncharacterized protein n=1 Tax=Dryococelus australis TaxID=614101 RepID=A0ABQ9IEU7_9NEOP|nr:hypothetical protein PR048_000052 [Dryococelus australis]
MKGLIYPTSVESKEDQLARVMAAADLGRPGIGDCVYQNMARDKQRTVCCKRGRGQHVMWWCFVCRGETAGVTLWVFAAAAIMLRFDGMSTTHCKHRAPACYLTFTTMCRAHSVELHSLPLATAPLIPYTLMHDEAWPLPPAKPGVPQDRRAVLGGGGGIDPGLNPRPPLSTHWRVRAPFSAPSYPPQYAPSAPVALQHVERGHTYDQHSGAAPYSPRSTLIGSLDLDITSRPYIYTPHRLTFTAHLLQRKDMGANMSNTNTCARIGYVLLTAAYVEATRALIWNDSINVTFVIHVKWNTRQSSAEYLNKQHFRRFLRITGESRYLRITGETRYLRITGETRYLRITGETRYLRITGESRYLRITGETRYLRITGESRYLRITGETRLLRITGETRYLRITGETRQGDGDGVRRTVAVDSRGGRGRGGVMAVSRRCRVALDGAAECRESRRRQILAAISHRACTRDKTSPTLIFAARVEKPASDFRKNLAVDLVKTEGIPPPPPPITDYCTFVSSGLLNFPKYNTFTWREHGNILQCVLPLIIWLYVVSRVGSFLSFARKTVRLRVISGAQHSLQDRQRRRVKRDMEDTHPPNGGTTMQAGMIDASFWQSSNSFCAPFSILSVIRQNATKLAKRRLQKYAIDFCLQSGSRDHFVKKCQLEHDVCPRATYDSLDIFYLCVPLPASMQVLETPEFCRQKFALTLRQRRNRAPDVVQLMRERDKLEEEEEKTQACGRTTLQAVGMIRVPGLPRCLFGLIGVHVIQAWSVSNPRGATVNTGRCYGREDTSVADTSLYSSRLASNTRGHMSVRVSDGHTYHSHEMYNDFVAVCHYFEYPVPWQSTDDLTSLECAGLPDTARDGFYNCLSQGGVAITPGRWFNVRRCDQAVSSAKALSLRNNKKLNTMSAYTRQKAKSKYRNRIRLETASQKQSSDAHKTPYDRVKRCWERKIYIKASERVNVDCFLRHEYQPLRWRMSEIIVTVVTVSAAETAARSGERAVS